MTALTTFFTYICTKSTADPYLPPMALNTTQLARDTSDAFLALSGGRFEVGKLALYPVQRAVPNHLLCDGSEVPQISFPELYAYLGDAGGTPANPANFVLPNYVSAFTPAATVVPETVVDGTVTTPVPTVPPPTYNPIQTDKTYGGVDSGGKYYVSNL